MKKKNKDLFDRLREAAETRLDEMPEPGRPGAGEQDVRRILHELRTHQIELQIQNEELQEAYATLQAARDNYYHLYNSAPVSYVTVSPESVIVEANAASRELFGAGPARLLKTPLASFVIQEDLAAFRGALRDIFLLLGKKTFEVRLKTGNGAFVYTRMEGSIAGDDPAKCRLVITDITELTTAQQELRRVNRSLEERVRERTEQLTELTAELGRAEQRERKRLSLILHDHLQQLLVGLRYMLFRLAPGMPERQFTETLAESQKLLQEAIESSRSLAAELTPPVLYDAGLVSALEWLVRWADEKYGLRVSLRIEREGITASEDMNLFLFQAAKEILFNIVKHARVKEASVALGSADDGTFYILVEDGGKGFDARIVAQKRNGMGLCHTAKRIEMLGGRMEIRSALGEGTSIRLTAPLKKQTAVKAAGASNAAAQQRRSPGKAKKPAEASSQPETLRIIVADDHAVVRDGLVRLLRSELNVEVVGEAENGRQAVDLARELKPDIVIMDINMPEMSGLEATRQIREDLPGTKIVVLSMHDREDMQLDSTAAGASAFISKSDPAESLVGYIRKAGS